MRIALVTESFLPSVNGVTNSVLRVLDTLQHAGHEAMVIAPTTPSSDYRGSPVVPSASVLLAGFPVAIPTPAVTQALEKFQPDLLHAAAPFWLGGHAISWAVRNSVPSVAVYQTDVAGYMSRYGVDFAAPLIDGITSAVHRQATLSLAPTPDGVTYLRGLGVDRVEMWGRGVDTELFHPARRSSREVANLRTRIAPRGEKVIGYVGRLAPEKQVNRLKELTVLSDATVVIVGDGPSRAELEGLFARDRVVFTGRLSGDDLANAYAAMDVFVHCGTEETFGQTIQEAHASGLPVIAPTVGGQRHLIRDGIDGVLVDPSRLGAFVDQAEKLLSDEVRWLRMSHEARAAVEGKTWEANNKTLLGYYADLVGADLLATPVAA